MKEQLKKALDNIGGGLDNEELFFTKLDGENLEKIKDFAISAKEYKENKENFERALDAEIEIEKRADGARGTTRPPRRARAKREVLSCFHR